MKIQHTQNLKSGILLLVILPFVLLVSCKKDTDSVRRKSTTITLNEPTYTDNKVELSWTVSNDSISSFNVIRVIGESIDQYQISYNDIASNLDKNTLTFTDEDVPYTPFITYLIQGIIYKGNNNPYNYKYVLSNSKTFSREISVMDFAANDVLLYARQNSIFLIDKENGLLKSYNYITKEQKDFDFKTRIGFCSLNKNGQTDELVVPRSDGWLDIYNAQDFQLIEQIKISAYSIASSVIKGNLIFNCTTSSDEPMIVYNRDTKQIVSKLTWYGDENRRLEIIPNTNTELFGVNSYEISYYNYDASGILISREYKDPWDDEYAVSARYCIIPNTKKFISAPLGNIYDNTISYISGLPRGNLKYSDFLVNNDGTKVYASSSNTKSIEIYNLSNLSHSGTIQTKAYPYRIFYNNGEIIVVSKTEFVDDYYTTDYDLVVETIPYAID